MDNDALLRRISKATNAKDRPAGAAAPATPAAPARQNEASARPSLLRRPVAEVVAEQEASAGGGSPQTQTLERPQVSAPPLAPAGSAVAAQAQAQPATQPAPQPEKMENPEPGVAPQDRQIARPGEKLLSFLPEAHEAERGEQPEPRPMRKEDRPEAFVIACDGSTATVQADTDCVDTVTGLTWAVGRMLSIIVDTNRVVAMICEINAPTENYAPDVKSFLRMKVELQGEVQDRGEGEKSAFVKGITKYPGVGAVVHQIRAADLSSIYAATGSSNAIIGHLSQDPSIPAYVDIPDMLSKHFAVLGSTGCGKSSSVSLLLHAAQEVVPDLRTIILDPHNEYSKSFPGSNSISQETLDLPFWLFQLEEYAEVLFRGKPIVHEEIDALREFIPEAKKKFREGEDRASLRVAGSSSALTADSPVPYRIADLVAMVDEEMGLLDSRYDKSVLKQLKARIVAHSSDPRYAFMFRHKTITDIAHEVIANIFNLPHGHQLCTILQMAGMPSEVVNSVASVLCRLAFELSIAAKGTMKILVVCEEAHRYVPVGAGGFEPTRRAIARIAKEGRKYGSFIAIISQRPSELDPTILSQCSTVFSLRLTNDYDQGIIRKAISSSSASTIAFISSLSNRECIAFGEGMSTPMRLMFRNMPKAWLPGAEADVFGNNTPVNSQQQSHSIFNQWRGGNRD